MVSRIGVSVVLGVVITWGLLGLMQVLIATGRDAVTDVEAGHIVDFVRVKPEETLQKKERKPEKPPQPQQPPPDAPKPQNDNIDPSADAISVAQVPVGADMDISSSFGLAVSDGDYLPIVKVSPVYPRRALQRGIEGHVIVEFTVTRQGTVRDPFVVESTSSLLEKAALEAVLKFKYKPKVVDGEPVEVAGVQNKITFRLES